MKNKDLQSKSRAELEALLVELRTALMQLHFDVTDGKVKDVSKFGKTKRDIARVLTLLRNTNS